MYKVLVIAYYFPPLGLSGVQRTLKFTKYFKNFGWEPTVLTTGDVAYYAHDISLLKEAEDAGINIIRTEGTDINNYLKKRKTIKMPSEFIRKFLSNLSKTFFIPDNKKGWAYKALETAIELLRKDKYDLIFVTAPPFSSINMAVKLKNIFNLPLVIDYRDLWLSNQYAFYPTPFHKIAHKKMEYRGLKKADRVIALNRKMKEKLIADFPFLRLDDIYIIPHGFDPQDFDGLQPELKESKKLRITYSGLFYEKITPKYFLKAFKKLLLERPDVASKMELEFIGLFRKENQRLVKKLDLLPYVKVHGYLEHKELLKKLIAADVLWAMIPDGEENKILALGKLHEYFGTRKPILLCTPADAAAKQAADQYGGSYIADPTDIDGIKNTLLRIFNDYTKNQFPHPNEEFIAKHKRDYLTELLTEQFEILLKQRIK